MPTRRFIHFDGPGSRFNGDHVPLEGKFPTNYWVPGYYVVDEHSMEPDRTTAAQRPTTTVYTGLWQGDARLKVVSGPSDGENRVKLGTVPCEVAVKQRARCGCTRPIRRWAVDVGRWAGEVGRCAKPGVIGGSASRRPGVFPCLGRWTACPYAAVEVEAARAASGKPGESDTSAAADDAAAASVVSSVVPGATPAADPAATVAASESRRAHRPERRRRLRRVAIAACTSGCRS